MMRRMAEERFTVVYDGPALDDHVMDVRELAPALIALSDAMAQAHRVLKLDGAPPRLQIAATAESSFEVQLALSDAVILGGLVSLFASAPSSAAANLAQLVQATTQGIDVIRRLAGRRAGREPTKVDGGASRVTLTLPDGTRFEAERGAADLAENAAFRRDVRRVVAPLEREGVDEMRIETPRAIEPVRLRASDLAAFEDEDPELPAPQESVMVLRPVTVTFRAGNKYRWTDGDAEFNAPVLDHVFAERVVMGAVRLAPQDELRCSVTTTQRRLPSGDLRAERVITKVLDYTPMPVPPTLPFDPTGDDEV